MVEDLVKRLRQQDVRQRGGYVVFNGIMAEAAATIEQQAASLAARDKEIERLANRLSFEQRAARISPQVYRERAEQAERALAEAVEVLRPLVDLIDQIRPALAEHATMRAARAFVAQHGSDSSKER